jgi:phenol hydroxylase P0 protein
MSSKDQPSPKADLTCKYVCVREVGADGNVRFDFAIGWPDLSIELVLPQTAFDEFCRCNDVRPMAPPDPGLSAPVEGE